MSDDNKTQKIGTKEHCSSVARLESASALPEEGFEPDPDPDGWTDGDPPSPMSDETRAFLRAEQRRREQRLARKRAAILDRGPTRPFYPGRYAIAESQARRLIDQITEQYAETYGMSRKADGRELLRGQIQAIIADALFRSLTGGGGIQVTMSTSTREKPKHPLTGRTFPKVVKQLAEFGYLDLNLGGVGADRSPTIFQASSELLQAAQESGVTLQDIESDDSGEVVVLRAPATKTKDAATGQTHKKQGEVLPFEDDDDPVIGHTRERLAVLNRMWEQADLRFTEGPQVLTKEDGVPVALSRRRMDRIFNNGDWQQGGRLYRGFWLAMRKADRVGRILIDGSSVVELDFKGWHPAMLYARVGMTLDDDPYLVPEAGGVTIPPTKQNRDILKAVFNAALSASSVPNQYPSTVSPEDRIPDVKVSDLIKAFRLKHAEMLDRYREKFGKDVFGTGVGLELQRQDSDLMLEVLFQLQRQGVVALPVHDSVIVPEGSKEVAKAVMVSRCQELLGFTPEIEIVTATSSATTSALHGTP
jgi:hypothetical protein